MNRCTFPSYFCTLRVFPSPRPARVESPSQGWTTPNLGKISPNLGRALPARAGHRCPQPWPRLPARPGCALQVQIPSPFYMVVAKPGWDEPAPGAGSCAQCKGAQTEVSAGFRRFPPVSAFCMNYEVQIVRLLTKLATDRRSGFGKCATVCEREAQCTDPLGGRVQKSIGCRKRMHALCSNLPQRLTETLE